VSFPRYPAYKDSGVAWLGEVPAHWDLPKIKGLATFSGGGTPSRENLSYWGGDIPWVSPKDMKAERISGAEECITADGLKNSASSLLGPGRVLMVVRSGILKHTIPVAINDVSVALNQDMKALDFAGDKCTSSFFLRWVQGLNDQLLLAWAKQGATVESIEHSYFANTILPLPPIEEQRAIAAFLDRETGRIDVLVAEQERLIALLREKRQAVISHAVTKGLDPSAPMKDSGVAWLGEVPAHWDVTQLHRLVDSQRAIMYGIVLPGPDVGSGVPLLKGGNVRPQRMNIHSVAYTTKEIEAPFARARLEEGDLVYSIRGTIGDCEPVPAQLAGANITQDVARIAVRADEVPRFVRWALLSAPVREELASGSLGAAVRGVNIYDLKRATLTLPPRSERASIAAYLDTETARIYGLIAEAERAMALLQERRAALISAAVTGQIDVRGLAAEEAA
jgi:type I restriction enzyme S subunit